MTIKTVARIPPDLRDREGLDLDTVLEILNLRARRASLQKRIDDSPAKVEAMKIEASYLLDDEARILDHHPVRSSGPTASAPHLIGQEVPADGLAHED